MDELGEMLSRFVIGQAKDLQLDGNGRILIPQELRDFAALHKHIVLVGRTQRLKFGRRNTNVEVAKSRELSRDFKPRESMSEALKKFVLVMKIELILQSFYMKPLIQCLSMRMDSTLMGHSVEVGTQKNY